MSRQKNSINNLKWGILGNIITSVVAIIIPRIIIINSSNLCISSFTGSRCR